MLSSNEDVARFPSIELTSIRMNKHTRAVLLSLFLIGLVGVNYLMSGSFALPTGDQGIWFTSGLFMLIVGAYWIEYYFTKPADVVINGIVVFIAASSLSHPPFQVWWQLLKYGSLVLVFAALVLVWGADPKSTRRDPSLPRRFVYQLVIRIGSSAVLFSMVFILALLSYFNVQEPQIRWAVLFWGVVLTARYLELDTFFKSIWNWHSTSRGASVGQVSRFSEPNIVRFTLFPDASCERSTLVAFTADGVVDKDSPIGVVVAHRNTLGAIEAEAILVDSNFEEGSPITKTIVVRVTEDDENISQRLSSGGVQNKLKSLIGYAFRGSDIAQLYVELAGDPQIEEGSLVSVALKNGKDLLFQIINGKLHEESGIKDGERSFTVAEAEQLGTWSKSRQGFETHSWVVPENACVFQVAQDSAIATADIVNVLDIGRVPRSDFPVKINVRDLVLYHSAILGVTGSGKSFLAYQLIEACAAANIKVLCLDLTGDYKRFLPDALLVRKVGELKPFLGSEHKIGIIEFTEEKLHPIAATNTVAGMALAWCKENRSPDEVKEPVPKVLLVCEEAHALIPEWNSNPEKNLQDTVSKTAQIVLQARKYGLGFMIVTQRTANVTKSVLNQCNTIFAFQAYDETGFDFMKNYMGLHYVNALPTLKKRQGVVVGKASVSDRPVIVRFNDQTRNSATTPLPEFKAVQPQAAAVPVVAEEVKPKI
jgi:hypothetical protein